MFAWIAENAVTILVTAVLLFAVGAAVFSLVKEKKSRSGGCTGNCASCGMGCSYRDKKE